MNLTEEQIGAIIEEHSNSIETIQSQRDAYKADAKKLHSVQEELEALKSPSGDYEK